MKFEKLKSHLLKNLKLYKYLFSILLVSSFIYIHIVENFIDVHDDVIWEVDEAAWIYSSYYYHLAFQEKNFTSPDWKDQDAKDHPPLAKFIYGFAFSFIDQVPQSLDDKRWWFANCDYYDSFWKQVKAKVNKESLVLGRFISLIFYVLSIFLFFHICQKILPLPFSLLATYYLSSNPIIIRRSAEILSDGILLFFILLNLVIQLRWIKNLLNREKSFYFLSILLGCSFAFIFQTKINGLLSVISVLFFLIGLFVFKNKIDYHSSVQLILKHFFVSLFSFVIISYLINPSLYFEPISFLKSMYQYRFDRLAFQQQIFGFDSIPTVWLPISTYFKRILITNDYLFRFNYIPLLQFGFVAGILAVIKKYKSNSMIVLLGVNAVVWIGAISLNYKMDWDRYLMPTLPFIYILMGIGLNYLWELRKNSFSNIKTVVGICITISLLLFSINKYDLKYYHKMNPKFRIEKEIFSLEFQLKRYEHKKDLWIKLRDAYEELGNHNKVKEIESIINKISK